MRETIRQAQRMLPHRNVFGQAGGIVPIATTFNVSKTPNSGGSDVSAAGHPETHAAHSGIPPIMFTGLDLW
jgi:hypothetical protein